MASINITGDTSQIQQALNALNQSLDASDDRVKEITRSFGVFNAAGVQVGATIQGLTNDGKQFSATLGLVNNAARQLAAAGVATNLALKSIGFQETANQANLLNSIVTRLGRNFLQFASYRSFSAITESISDGVKAAKDFEVQISLIRTISQDKQLSFSDFGEGIRRASNASGIDLNKVGKAFYDTTSNQIAKGADVEPFVKSASEFARVTGSELPDSVNLLSSAINAYGLSVKDADRISAIFFRTIDEGRVVASELANTFGRVAVLGSNIGVSIEDLNAVLAITTQKGFKTSDAMTLLTNLLIKLEKPTEATKAFFQSLGVDTGEAAIKLLGFNGVLRKMVESVQSGQVDVSAFFDEIRGRKQFGVFQQSLGQIEEFSNKLKNTAETMRTYNEAIKIRGESPADQLNKELNKLSNIFKVDFGTAIVEATAKTIQFLGGVDQIPSIASKTAETVGALAVGLGIYGTVALATAERNTVAAASFARLGTAAGVALKTIGAALVAYSVYEVTKKGLNLGSENAFGTVDPKQLNSTADAIERIQKNIERLRQSQKGVGANPFADIDAQSKNIGDTFQTVLKYLANANLANNKFLDDAKTKSKEVAENVKVSFATYIDTVKNGISELKKGITEANSEIEKSRKFTLSLADTIDAAILKSQLHFADDTQKVDLLESKITRNVDRIRQLYASGDEKQVEEARRLAKETIQDISTVSDQVNEIDKKSLEQYYQAHPEERSPGGNIFNASTETQQKRLLQFKALLENLETTQRRTAQTTINENTKIIESEEKRLRTLQDALKAYEQLNVFEKSGSLKAEYKDKETGKFDPTRLNAELDRLEANVRANFVGTSEQRTQLELTLAQKRASLNAEITAQERADFLKTSQQRLLAEDDAYKKRQEQLKTERDTAINNQQDIFTRLTQQQTTLQAFANALGEQGINGTDKEQITGAVQRFNNRLVELKTNTINKDGLSILDPKAAEEALARYNEALNLIIKIRDASGGRDLSVQDANKRTITPGQAKDAAADLVDELGKNTRTLLSNLTTSKAETGAFDALVKKPVEDLKALFPELADTATTSLKTVGNQFQDLAKGGVQQLIDQLREVQKLMQQVPPNQPGLGGKVGAIEGGEVYAATGGIVGLFPGQPRGVDVYPIWAAAGERIISAETSRMYAPMLDAIMSRRMPRYMANGGIVGDTTIGDINVTVNGARTNADTGREIANKLSREFRRRNISFNTR